MWKGMRIYQEVSYRSLIVTKLRIMEYKSHLFFLSRLYKTSNLRMSRLRKIWAKIGADANIKVISPPPPPPPPPHFLSGSIPGQKIFLHELNTIRRLNLTESDANFEDIINPIHSTGIYEDESEHNLESNFKSSM